MSDLAPVQQNVLVPLKLACRADLWYNEEVNSVVSEGAVTPLRRVTNLLRRLATMNTLPPHDQDDNPLVHTLDGCRCTGKYCKSCETFKCRGAFHRDKHASDGLISQCKACRSAYRRTYQPSASAIANRKAQMRAYSETHREEKRVHNANYYQLHHAEIREQQREYRNNHIDDVRRYGRMWRESHREYNKEVARNDRKVNREGINRRRRSRYQKNAEHVKQQVKRYQESHREQVRARQRKHRAANFSSYAIRNRAYRLANIERVRLWNRAIKARRRARQSQTEGSYTVQEWLSLKDRYSHMCLCCGKQEPDIKLTADHVIPVIKGGSSYIENIQPLCGSCNSKKHTKIIDYRTYWDQQNEEGDRRG